MERQERRQLGRGAIPIASTIILICILASSWITYDRVNGLLDTRGLVAHTWEVKEGLEEVYSTVATAESDIRAYLISREESSYVRYLTSQTEANDAIARVRSLTSDNRRQGPLLDRLQEAVDERYRAMEATADARRTRELQPALDVLQNGPNKGRGIRAMNLVRKAIERSVGEENRLLTERMAAGRYQTIQAELAFVFTIAISVVLISAFGLLSNRLVAHREAAADEERSLRSDLEREIARTKAAEIRLERIMLELRRSNEELQNFAFVASHDLQEPLRKIRAFSDRVRRRSGENLDAESKDSLQRVEAAADRMQRLILDLLELSRITTKSRPHVEVDLAAMLDEVTDDLLTRLEETGGKLIHESLPTVVADPAQLRQLFQNLIANALKFRREGTPPVVRIKGVARPDGRVEIELSDNGIGFEEKYADRIFVVFQRLHGRGEYEGSGIGLAIVRKIVERHGGKIEAHGHIGDGATFRFDLPGESSTLARDATIDEGENE